MKHKAVAFTAVIAFLMMLAGFIGCEKQESPVGNQEGATVQPGENQDYQAIAEALASGTMPKDQYNELTMWDEDARKTLRDYVLQYLSEEEIEASEEVYYIVGGNGEMTSAEEINEIGQLQAEKEGLTRNLDWVLYVEVPFYSQNDWWSGYHLGYSNTLTIGSHGCHLCCISMLYAKWGYCPPNQCPSMFPPGLNNWAYAGCAHYAFANGTANIRLPQALQYPGICRPYGWINSNQVWGHLQAGHPVIAQTWQYGGTHFVVIFAHDGLRYWVKDPVKNAANQNQWLGNVIDLRVYGYNP